MSDIAIRVDGLGKSYRIGGKRQRYKTLRDTLTDTFMSPVRKAGKLLRGEASGAAELNETIWSLKNVSFEVKHGEVVGIIGRNGAGKTTLLKILSRITEPSEGHADIYGRVGSLLEVGTGFHPELTGRENTYLNGAILGMKKAEIDRKFDEIVAFAEIEKFLDTPVKYYSSGMYVRLAFAVAAHLEPEILVVDEVLAVGDAAFQKKCLGKMGDVAKEGRTVLFVSHNMAAVEALCTEAIVLSVGELAFRGTTSEAIQTYLRSVNKKTSQKIRDRKDRSGNGQLFCTEIALEDGEGKPIDTFISGKDACIVLNYRAKNTLKNVRISIGIYGLHGQFLLLCNNEMVGYSFESIPKKGQIRCLIPRLPFAPGIHILNLYCEVNGVLADWVQDACQITVVDGDFYGTGKSSPSSHGGFLADQKWSFNSAVTANYDA